MGRWMDAAGATSAQKPSGAELTKPPEAPAAPLLAVLAVPDPGVSPHSLPTSEAAPIAAGVAGCGTCAHRTQAGVCGAPVAAGLAPRFEVFFCDAVPDGGVGCPAQEPKPAVWRGAWGTLADRGSTVTNNAATGLVLCTNCKHWYPGRCRNYRAAGLTVSELAAGWHALPQRCAGFKKARTLVEGPTHGAVIAAPA